MNYLLDTHVALWWLNNDAIATPAAAAIADRANRVCVSAASIWEIVIKRSAGKLRFDDDGFTALQSDFDEVTITGAHARAVAELPAHHRDPFDRMLIAQARVDGLTIITRDRTFAAYEVATLAA